MYIKDMLLTPNKYSRPQTKIGKVEKIVLHWIGNAGTSAEANAKYFEGLKVGKKNSAGNYIYASAHYIVGNDGVVVRCVPDDEVAYHASEANGYALGVEICHTDWEGKPTQWAYESLVDLLVSLCRKYKLKPTQAIIRHYDVTGKICPKWYVECEEDFEKVKQDVEKVLELDVALIKAVGVLHAKGIITQPEVWNDVENIRLRNVAALISKIGQYKYGCNKYDCVILHMIDEGIITANKIWKQRTYSRVNVRDFVVKVSSRLQNE